MKMCLKKIMHFSLLTAVVVLPGCSLTDWFSKKSSGEATQTAAGSGEALVTYHGKTLITTDQFNEKLVQLLKANPYMRQMNMTPEQFPLEHKKRMLNDWATVSVIREVWGSQSDIENNTEFKEKLQAQIDNFKDVLVTDLFVQSVKSNLKHNDAELEREAKAEYEKNKKAKYIKVLGGVRVNGVSFSSKEKAQAFYDKAKANVADFDKLAEKESSGKARDFGRVSAEESNTPGAQQVKVPSHIRSAAMAGHKVPRVEMVAADKEHWVLNIADKKDTVYFDFDEIKAQLKEMMETNKLNEILQKKVEELKKDMFINEKLLGSPEVASNSVEKADIEEAPVKEVHPAA